MPEVVLWPSYEHIHVSHTHIHTRKHICMCIIPSHIHAHTHTYTHTSLKTFACALAPYTHTYTFMCVLLCSTLMRGNIFFFFFFRSLYFACAMSVFGLGNGTWNQTYLGNVRKSRIFLSEIHCSWWPVSLVTIRGMHGLIPGVGEKTQLVQSGTPPPGCAVISPATSTQLFQKSQTTRD